MARLNIEDCWWSDPRRAKLVRLLGGDSRLADGLATEAWRLAQEFWKHGRQLVPVAQFESLEGHEKLIEAGLAVAEQSFVYVRGSSQYLEWVADRREQAVEAGKKSAQARLAKSGTAQPKPKKPRTKPERLPNEPRTESNDAEPSVSGSYSVSDSKNEDTLLTQCVDQAPQASLNLPAVAKRSKFSELTRAKMQAFIAAYAAGWKAKYKGSPEGIRQKEIIGKVGHWLESVSQERAINLVQVYLQIDYRPFNESYHDLWQFFRHLNRIGVALDSGSDSSTVDWSKVFAGAA